MPADAHLLWLVASAIGAAALAALLALYRRAAARHELEEAERILAEEYDES